jgi:16S rRNA U516 pseudouridylate synthase RsuA-like enzyme
MYYVTMTDKFLSGWGMADKKIAKYVYECETLAEANIVADNANSRNDQKNVNITTRKPYYNKDRYYVSYKDKGNCSNWYEKGFFSKQH